MNEKEKNLSHILTGKDARDSFIAMVEGRALGASSNIRTVMSLIQDMAKNRENDALDSIDAIITYIDMLRGDSSIAVRNAVNDLRKSLLENLKSLPIGEAADRTVRTYKEKMEDDSKKLIEAGVETLRGCRRIFVFDYSSSVDAILLALLDSGEEFTTVTAESRLLNGGLPYLKSLARRNAKVNFVLDCCMDSAIRDCDAVIIGAETVYREGSVINTAGSELAAYGAYFHHVPFYVATTFQKYDGRGEKMFPSKDEECSMEERLSSDWGSSLREIPDFTCHGFSLVPAELVTGYFTEKGYLNRDEFQNSEEV